MFGCFPVGREEEKRVKQKLEPEWADTVQGRCKETYAREQGTEGIENMEPQGKPRCHRHVSRNHQHGVH